MYHDIKIDDDATFIGDAHYNPQNRVELIEYLDSISSYQIIFMGDIFDLLFGSISLSQKLNKDLIDKINTISTTKVIIYLEGNHDFELDSIFPNLRVFSISQQPLLVTYRNRKTLLSHGDNFGEGGYRVISAIIRNRLLLITLNLVDTTILNNTIMKRLINKMDSKILCTDIAEFDKIVQKRVQKYKELYYDVEHIIEGHFHQDEEFDIDGVVYTNLASFACVN